MTSMTDASPAAPDADRPPVGARVFTRADFDRAYAASIGHERYVEIPRYYVLQKPRYFRTLEALAALPMPRPASILEIGGGQMAVLSHLLFGDKGTVGDISETYAEPVLKRGVGFMVCNLLQIPDEPRGPFDLIVLCEVIEHLPVPGYTVLEKLARWLAPGGRILMTTPNFYRLRNVVRLALGLKMHDRFQYPEPGVGLGHQLEYSRDHLAWQIERAGLEVEYCRIQQLANRGHSLATDAARFACAPLLALVPRWRDGLVACARKAP